MEILLWPERAGDPEAEAAKLLFPARPFIWQMALPLASWASSGVSEFPQGFHSAFSQKCSECLPETCASKGGMLNPTPEFCGPTLTLCLHKQNPG